MRDLLVRHATDTLRRRQTKDRRAAHAVVVHRVAISYFIPCGAVTMKTSRNPGTLQARRIGSIVGTGAFLLGGALSANAFAESIVGLTNTQQLSVFDSTTPGSGSSLIAISGLQTNEVLLGIDYRPSTGILYGLGNSNRLYTLDAGTGVASLVASLTSADGSSPFALAGQAFGVDFNPVPDLGGTLPSLRVTSDSGENLRINVNGSNAGRVAVDGALSGPSGAPTIGASAYTNPDRDPNTGTALFGIDFGNESVYQQIPPNDGTLVLVGPLGVDTTGHVGYDISASGIAYASLTDPATGKSSLYTIGAGGGAVLVGAFGIGGNTAIAPSLSDIAVTPVPEPAEYALFAAGLAIVACAVRRRRSGPTSLV